MGQIFNAIAYDVENRKCYATCADKFHANCYSYSGAVSGIYHLLRQKAYNVMWGGAYVVIDDYLEDIEDKNILLGISTYTDYEDFVRNNDNIEEKKYYDKVKYIDTNHGTWEIKSFEEFWDDVVEAPTMEKYKGFLVNHTKKVAIRLEDYLKQSISSLVNGELMLIDAIPILTETGEGTSMALFEGVYASSTEDMEGQWCGDLLQVVDMLPTGYEQINFCIAEIWRKAVYCRNVFGTNEEGFLPDKNNKLFVGAARTIWGDRGRSLNLKIEREGNTVRFIPVYIE